jgi:hypothetical protein
MNFRRKDYVTVMYARVWRWTGARRIERPLDWLALVAASFLRELHARGQAELVVNMTQMRLHSAG